MIQLTVNGKHREYPFGTTWQTVAEDVQAEFTDDILLVQVDGKLRELHKRAKECKDLRMITARDKVGKQTYRRSLKFLMQENIRRVRRMVRGRLREGVRRSGILPWILQWERVSLFDRRLILF